MPKRKSAAATDIRTTPSLTVLETDAWTITWVESGSEPVIVYIVETRIARAGKGAVNELIPSQKETGPE